MRTTLCCPRRMTTLQRHTCLSKIILFCCTAVLVHLCTMHHAEHEWRHHREQMDLLPVDQPMDGDVMTKIAAGDKIRDGLPERRRNVPQNDEMELPVPPANDDSDLNEDDEEILIVEVDTPQSGANNDLTADDELPAEQVGRGSMQRKGKKNCARHARKVAEHVGNVALVVGVMAAFAATPRLIKIWMTTIFLSLMASVAALVASAHLPRPSGPSHMPPHHHFAGLLVLHAFAALSAVRLLQLSRRLESEALSQVVPTVEGVVLPVEESSCCAVETELPVKA